MARKRRLSIEPEEYDSFKRLRVRVIFFWCFLKSVLTVGLRPWGGSDGSPRGAPVPSEQWAKAQVVEPAILTPEEADQSCVEFTHQTLLSKLNRLSGLDLPMEYKGVRSGIDYLISKGHDIGTAYAWFRTACQFTHTFTSPEGSRLRGELPDLSEYGPHLMEAAYDDRDIVRSWAASELGWASSLPATKQSAPTPGIYVTEDDATMVIHPELIPPRRLWDLRSNRIVPYDWQCHFVQSPSEPGSTKHTQFAAISHSWTNDMSPVSTSINKGQWGVPLPRGVTIEKLRQELLQLRKTEAYSVPIEYCWLDVLCLRQASDDPQLEEIKLKEWKTDIPTIGNAYRQADLVARYMNGLGIPFRVDGWDSKYHWTRRVWTLQEVAYSSHAEAHKKKNITMGLPVEQENCLDFILVQVGIKLTTAAEILNTPIQGKITTWPDLRHLISEVDSRCCSHESDKIAALSYLISLDPLPVYNAKDNIETAWAKCCAYLHSSIRLDMLLQPIHGFPTWASLTAKPREELGFNPGREKPWAVLAHSNEGCYRGPGEFLGGTLRMVGRNSDPADGPYTWHSKFPTHDQYLWAGQVRVQRRPQSNCYFVTSNDEISARSEQVDFCIRNCDSATVVPDECYILLALHRETYGHSDTPRFVICKVLLEDEIPSGGDFEPSQDRMLSTIIHMRKMAVFKAASGEDTRKASSVAPSLNKAWEGMKVWEQEQNEADGPWRPLTLAGQPHSVKYYIYL